MRRKSGKIFEELCKFIDDLNYEFGERSKFFQENKSKLSPFQKQLIETIGLWNRSRLDSLDEEQEMELEEFRDTIDDLEVENRKLDDENYRLQDEVDEFSEKLRNLESGNEN